MRRYLFELLDYFGFDLPWDRRIDDLRPLAIPAHQKPSIRVGAACPRCCGRNVVATPIIHTLHDLKCQTCHHNWTDTLHPAGETLCVPSSLKAMFPFTEFQ